MKKKVFSLMMTFLLAFVGIARADELTVNDGTTTNGNVPVYGFYADAYNKCEFVQPAADLAAMAGGTINGVTFYASQSSVSWGSANFQVFLTEVGSASISDFNGPGTVVYEGALSISGGTMTVNFTTPYTYNGGNLLVGVYQTTTGSYVTSTWYGVSATGASGSGYNYSSLSGCTFGQKNFLPKMNFDYTAGAGGGGGAPVDHLHVKYMDGADEIIDTLYLGERPAGAWMEPFEFTMYTDGQTYTVNVLDFTPSDGMFTVAGEELPFQVNANGVDLTIATNATVAGTIERQFVAITEGDRAAHIWPIAVDMYQPAIPDVWEMAYDLGTVGNGFSYAGVPSDITPTVLHNDYTLPFPEIEEGEDAVYKFTVATDMILNAYVDTLAENGKVALYTEDFYGEGGPMATNNYTGLASVAGGGAAGGAFEAMIGDESSTTSSTYFPFHTLWNYSLAENLFLASELTEAGVTTAPMTSLSWYVKSTTCTTAQNNISIWMGNVDDAALTSTSHTTAGMTLVYTGNGVLPTAGQWNEFVFNAGNFAWDGHSNILILCQRQNGSYQGSISWQTHNPGFAGMAYAYTDNAPGYDATTQTYSLSTSTTNRQNIIFKGGNRDRAAVDVVIGDPTSTTTSSYVPGYSLYDFAISQQIYTADEIGTAGAINALTLWLKNSSSYARDINVYMKEVSNATFSGGDWVSMTASDMVASFTMNNGVSSPVEMAIDLTTPFNYTGNGNLVICCQDVTGQWSSGLGGVVMDANGTQALYDYRDNTVFDPSNPGVSGTTLDKKNVVKLNITPTGGASDNYSAGPVIEDMPIAPGTYYLVASATEADYTVYINVDNMPCPAIDAEGFAFNPQPADDEDEVEPGSVTLRWMVPDYATGWRLIFGTTYYPDPNHPQTVMYPEDGSFTDHQMANSYTVRNLWNNTNYFWRVEFNNDACPDGVSSPVWGFTTHLNIPTNLTAVDYTVFDDEQIVLNWNAVVDRTYRKYFIYRDGVKIGETTVNQIGNTTYTDGPLAYNMAGYTYYVTAVYDEGESAPSDPVTVKVSGYGDVNGHVYEQDGTTGIANATVTMVGTDEFGVSHTYNFTTNGQGYYTGHIYAGTYNGSAACSGYQTIYEPVQGNPIAMVYNTTTSPIDYILDENFDPVCSVLAEYYPEDTCTAPYVKVSWGCGLPGEEIIEPFETGDFSAFDWQIDPTYPWSITTNNPYEGTYCMKSGGAGVANVVSNMTVTVNIPADGVMSFWGKISCENNWDFGYFYIDGVQKASFSGAGNWVEKTYDVTAGDHTFQWRYTKDGSVNSNDDCFYVDYITFYKRPEPAVPGMTYDFEDGTMQGWTSVDADGDGYGWVMGSEIMTGQPGNNGSSDFVLSQSYYQGTVLYPDNYLVSPQVQLGGIVRFYACAQDASYAAEHFGVAVSTTNTNPSSFTMLQEWTMTAKSVGTPKDVKLDPTVESRMMGHSRNGNHRAQGNWYEYTVDLSAYSGMGYVAIRHFNCSDMFYLNVDDITIGEPGKGIAEGNRSLNHYRVYRTNCYNMGEYTTENTVLLATVWVPDTVYIDVEWADLEPGVYKWGVGAVYEGNRGEMIEAPINWTEPVSVRGDRTEFTYGFEGGLDGWTVIDVNADGGTWLHSDNNLGGYDYTDLAHGGTGFAMCYSYVDYDGAYNTNSYLVSPQKYSIDANSSLSFWADNANDSYPENFSVCVATADNPTAADFTQVWSGGAKAGNGAKANVRHDANRYENWRSHSIDLSAYAGQDVWIAFHDVNYDQYEIWIDDVTVVANNGGTPGPGPDPGVSNGLQLPRESEIVWSNCLDKDMYLTNGDVTVNVLLNSADSPEGVQVTFTNLNDVEQELYPIAPIIMDETGYYAFDSFRKGEYRVNVTFEGYEPIEEEVSIWEPTDLRYVMIEIIYGIDNLYVSSTGWAMWDAQGMPAPTPGPGPGPGTGDTEFTEGFEGGLNGWNVLTVNADGGNWIHSSGNLGGYDYTTLAHGGTGFAMCYSYVDYVGAYNTDSYMYTPQKYSIVNGSTLTFWADNANDSYPENFSVCVATADNPTAADFTQVWSGGAKAGNGAKANVRHDANRYENWRSHSIDLSAYAGQNVYIAFHDVNYDAYEIWIDDVALTTGAKSDERHLEAFKVMCTSIDGEPIYNANVPADQPFCQLATEELVPGDHYICKVAAIYSTGMSDWVEQEWQYLPCENYAGTVSGVTVEGNEISWEYPGTPGPGPQPGQGDTFTESWDNGLNGWTNIDADGDGHVWYHSTEAGNHSTMAVDSHSGAGHLMGESYCNATWAALTPDDYIVSPQQYAITNGSTISIWACTQDVSYPSEHFGFAISTGSNTNASDFTTVAEWTITAKGAGKGIIGRDNRNTREGNWYQFSADLSNYAGQNVWIAVRHFNCTDMFILCIDDIELTAGAKGNRAMWDFLGSFTGTSAGQQGIATDGNFIYTCSWQASPAGGYTFYQYTMDGTFVEGFNISGVTELRDLTYDGQYFYAGKGSSVLYCIDLANRTLVGQTNTTCSTIRHCSYDPVNDGFWVGNWSDLKLVDRSGATLTNGPALESAYGSAYYDNHLYLFTQPNSDARVYDYDILANTLSSTPVFSFTGNLSGCTGIAGGAFIGQYGNKIAFFGNVQQDPNLIGIYELADAGTPGPTPTPGEGNVLGAMIFVDGEWEAFVPYPTNNYVYEGEGNEVCVRMVYDGPNNLPEGNIYYSMSCPECEEIVPGFISCEAGAPIHGEQVDPEHIKVWWGEEPAAPISEWLYYDNGTYATSVGTNNASATIYWATMFPAASLAPYAGTNLTKVAVFEFTSNANPVTVTIHLGGTTAPGTAYSTTTFVPSVDEDFEEVTVDPVAIDGTQNLWIVCAQMGTHPAHACTDTGDPNNRWISLDGTAWQDLAAAGLPGYGWLLRGFVTNQGKGSVENIAIELPAPAAPATNTGVLSHTEVVSIPAPMAFMNRANLVKYNVYRSTEPEGDYTLIGEVAETGADYYEYIDEPGMAGTFYYQVRAYYDNDCESEPALAADDPTHNYVTGTAEGIGENSDNVALYPNPTNGNVTIEAQGMNRITVVSVLGQVVFDTELSADNYTLNMAQFNAGMYMVRVYTESGVTVKRVTVMQ